jgi:hypothetical protein
MSDIIHKILDMEDIFRYFSEYLNFDDKISFSKLINKNLIKNIDIFNKKYNKKNLSEFFYICGDCFDNLSNDMYHTLTYNYKNFLLYNSDENDDNDDDNEEEEEYINNNDIIIRSSIIKDEIEFIYSNCYYIAVKAFLEILDSKNISLNIENYECIFHLELSEDIYELIYDKMQCIYENAIINNLLEIFCEKCGNFGHCSLSNKCVLYNKNYINKEIKYYINEIINDLVKDVISIVKKKKIIKKKKKHLCKYCKLKFFNKKCYNKLCGNCCQCINHIK